MRSGGDLDRGAQRQHLGEPGDRAVPDRTQPWLTEVPSSCGWLVPWMPMIGSWPLNDVSVVE
jgi:hypothetical protein